MNEPDTPKTCEIDLRVIGKHIWAARWPVLLVALIVTIGYWAGVVAKWASTPRVYNYSQIIQLTFASTEKNY